MHPRKSMMFVDRLATATDVTRLLGEVQPLDVARILEVAPTRAELEEAVRELEDEPGFGEEPRTPSSARVACVRAAIADMLKAEQELDPASEWRGS